MSVSPENGGAASSFFLILAVTNAIEFPVGCLHGIHIAIMLDVLTAVDMDLGAVHI